MKGRDRTIDVYAGKRREAARAGALLTATRDEIACQPDEFSAALSVFDSVLGGTSQLPEAGTTEEFFDLALDPLEAHDLISAGVAVPVRLADLDRLRLALNSFEGNLVYEGL